MTGPALFDLPDAPAAAPAPVDDRTSGQRLRDRQAARIEHGMHPLSYDGRVIRLHPSAVRLTENDRHGADDYRCGSCRFREVLGGHARGYVKCTVGGRLAGSEASDIRSWWPGCEAWEPREEPHDD